MLETKYPYVDAVFASPPPPSLCWLWFNKLMKPDCRFDLNAGSEMRRRRRSLQFCRDASNILPFAARHTSIFLILLRNKRMQWHSTTKYIPFVREFQSVSLMASFRYISVQQSASFFSSMQKETNDVIPPSFLLSFWLVCAFQSWALRKKRRNWELARHSVPPFSREKYTDGRG